MNELVALHDRAGSLQGSLLERYPGAPDALPLPLRDDLKYYDGAQFYMLHISGALEEAGHDRALPLEQQLLLVSTNGLNDWWMDESARRGNGERTYGTVIEAFDGINAVCYSYLNPEGAERTSTTVSNPEVRRLVDYYGYVLDQMPEEHKSSIARLLISINLYQGISLYQERGFREYMGLGNNALNERNIDEDNIQMLHRMRVEKGGIIFTYFWPYFTEITDGIVIPDQPPTIVGTIKRFLDGNSLYPEGGIGRRLLEIGGINQMMDDSCDRALDWSRGVVSPENVGVAFYERSNETWDEMVERILAELAALMSPDDDEEQELVVDAARNAVAGLTLYRANRDSARAQ